MVHMDEGNAMRAVLITGGGGYIGLHTAYLFAQQGVSVVILDDLRHGFEVDEPWVKVVRGDFADTGLLQKIFTTYAIDLVVHCAASIEVGQSQHAPQEYYDNNVVKTIILLDCMRQFGVSRLVFSSSCAVYGMPQQIPMREDHPRNPLSVYGNTKLCVELIIEDYARAYGLQFVVLRYFNAAGGIAHVVPGERHNPESHLIPVLFKAVAHQQPFMLFGVDYATPDGSCIRDFVHVVDIADAHVRAYRYLLDARPSGFFNLGTGKGYSVKEVIAAVEQVTGSVVQVAVADRRQGDAPVLVADPSKAMHELGWVPQHSALAEIIASAFAWEQKNKSKKN